jgi:hypothetical protein
MTADNAYRKSAEIIYTQNCIVPKESNLQSQGYLNAVIHIYSDRILPHLSALIR